MSRPRTVVIALSAVLLLGAGLARAQFMITDPAVTLRNTVIAVVKHQVLDTLTEQGDRLRRMAARLSAATTMDRYAVPLPPRWRIYRFQETNLYANPYAEALNAGDREGVAYDAVARARATTGSGWAQLAPAAHAAVAAQLATVDLADSTIITGTDQNGRLRSNGKREMRAIDALERDVVDPSSTRSATAVLETISGAGLIRARQQQARIQFLGAIVEQLLVDNKRARDTEAAAMNMQLSRLRGGQAAHHTLVAGTADDVRAWRQP